MFFKTILYFTVLVLQFSLAAAQDQKPSAEYEKKITQASVSELMTKLGNVINNREQQATKSFFSYYADSDARFIKTSYLIDADNSDNILANEGINLSRSEYADYLINVFSTPTKYFYRQSDIQFKVSVKPTDAMISYHVDEVMVKQILATSVMEKYEKTLTSANCNMNVQLSGIGLKIMGLNCVEKIARKTLEIENQN